VQRSIFVRLHINNTKNAHNTYPPAVKHREDWNLSATAYHLEEREVGDEAVVKVDFGREPGEVVQRSEHFAVVLGRDDVETDQHARLVHAAAESAAEQVDAHDAEDEPEDQTDEQHVEDGRDRLDQRVHDHLQQPTATRTVPLATIRCEMLF